jgi:hypothetical protein
MSVAMAVLYRRLPWWQPWSLPPRGITANVLKSIGMHEHMSREAETVATTVGHFAYGTFAGAVYGALPVAIRRHALTSGVLYGLAVWAGSYGIGLPALRLATPLPYRSGKRIGLLEAVGASLKESRHVFRPGYRPASGSGAAAAIGVVRYTSSKETMQLTARGDDAAHPT